MNTRRPVESSRPWYVPPPLLCRMARSKRYPPRSGASSGSGTGGAAKWRSARPFGEPPRRDGNGLTGIERELLELLGRGLTDEAAARKLGVSLRTVRRMMADLTTRLGATSRFQAGMRAHQLGWLTDPDSM